MERKTSGPSDVAELRTMVAELRATAVEAAAVGPQFIKLPGGQEFNCGEDDVALAALLDNLSEVRIWAAMSFKQRQEMLKCLCDHTEACPYGQG